MIIKGYKNPLTSNDMWALDRKNTSEEIDEKFDKIWIPTVEKAKIIASKKNEGKNEDNLPNVGILIPIIRTFWPQMLFAATLIFVSTLMSFVNPLVLDLLISFITNPNEPIWKGYLYALLMFFSPMIQSILTNQSEYIIVSVGMRVRTCIISAIFKKVI
jgi:ABC-type bacteriocin/lantibiotic exporter with double-glycine peptidase domain